MNNWKKNLLDNLENINKKDCEEIKRNEKEKKEDIIEIDSKDLEKNTSFNETKLNIKQNVASNNFLIDPNELSKKKRRKKYSK